MADSGVIELVLKGLAAGAVGTAAMTLSEKVEQSKTGREDSMVTTEVGAILVTPALSTGAQAARLGKAVHWDTWDHLGSRARSIGTNALERICRIGPSLRRALDQRCGALSHPEDPAIAPQVGTQAVATDLFHKLVLSVVTSLVFLLITAN